MDSKLFLKRVKTGYIVQLNDSLIADYPRSGYKKALAALDIVRNVYREITGKTPWEQIDAQYFRDDLKSSSDEYLMTADMTGHGGYRPGAGRKFANDEKPYMKRSAFNQNNALGGTWKEEDFIIGENE